MGIFDRIRGWVSASDDDDVRTDLEMPEGEWSKPVRVMARERMSPITFTLNPACPTCGQALPKKP